LFHVPGVETPGYFQEVPAGQSKANATEQKAAEGRRAMDC
jgi:hypothetical protein